MSFRFTVFAVVLCVSVLCTGCGKDESESASADGSDQTAQTDAATSDENAAAAEGDASGTEAPAPQAAPPPTGPMKDVAIAPSKDGEPMKTAFIFYTAKEAAPALAEFHKNDLEAKGWKIGRNDVTKLPGSTMSGAVQQYEKGSDVLTVLLAEQVGEGTTTSVCVMDIPLPPTTTFINPYGGQGTGEILEPPAEAMAWFTKELTARGWTADKPQDAGGTHAINFRKGQRTLATQFRDAGGARKGSSFYFMHMG